MACGNIIMKSSLQIVPVATSTDRREWNPVRFGHGRRDGWLKIVAR